MRREPLSTRREVIALIAATPLLASAAHAAETVDPQRLFDDAMKNLQTPAYVFRQWHALGFYLELMHTFPPKKDGYKPDDLKSADFTYTLLTNEVTSRTPFDPSAAAKIQKELVAEYQKQQSALWQYLTDSGIMPKSNADIILETAIASMLLFYATVTKVTKAAEAKWCIFPFCLARPV